MNTVISIQGIGKQYKIGATKRPSLTLRDAITDAAMAPFRRLRHAGSSSGRVSTMWALRDITFDVPKGEVVGIIGPNGAGKSTLLKVVARITDPTEGKAFLHGRVGSLLEVGTGFHQELTGRENTYLMGAILGMGRTEINRKFDSIVEFAAIGEFLDTPVKRYSTGMFVRLAFAVAAHLEPEILLVDEVLSVGDLSFQRKCLGRMETIAGEGRTIFFVSHNMNAVRSLCTRAIEIREGRMVADGPVDEVVRGYIAAQTAADASTELTRPLGNDDELKITAARVRDEEGNIGGPFHTRDPLIVEIEFDVYRPNDAYEIGFDLLAEGGLVFRDYQTLASPEQWPPIIVGHNVFRCVIPAGLLNEGRYAVAPRAGVHLVHWIVNGDDAIWFEVIKDHSDSPFFWVRHPGPIAPVLDWSAESSDAPVLR